jgi:hypothetical protein
MVIPQDLSRVNPQRETRNLTQLMLAIRDGSELRRRNRLNQARVIVLDVADVCGCRPAQQRYCGRQAQASEGCTGQGFPELSSLGHSRPTAESRSPIFSKCLNLNRISCIMRFARLQSIGQANLLISCCTEAI